MLSFNSIYQEWAFHCHHLNNILKKSGQSLCEVRLLTELQTLSPRSSLRYEKRIMFELYNDAYFNIELCVQVNRVLKVQLSGRLENGIENLASRTEWVSMNRSCKSSTTLYVRW